MAANLAALRNLVISASRKRGYANIGHASHYHARNDRRTLQLYGYA
jgi:hypothetical protein